MSLAPPVATKGGGRGENRRSILPVDKVAFGQTEDSYRESGAIPQVGPSDAVALRFRGFVKSRPDGVIETLNTGEIMEQVRHGLLTINAVDFRLAGNIELL
jgi:hypothetical protein